LLAVAAVAVLVAQQIPKLLVVEAEEVPGLQLNFGLN